MMSAALLSSLAMALGAEAVWFEVARLPIDGATAIVEGQLGLDHPEPQQLRLAIERPGSGGIVVRTYVSGAATASRVERLELASLGCGPPGASVVACFVDERPDEVRRTVLAVGAPATATPVQLLRYAATAAELPAGEPSGLPGPRPGLAIDRSATPATLALGEAPIALALAGPGGVARAVVSALSLRRFACAEGTLQTDRVEFVERFPRDSAAPAAGGDGDPRSFLTIAPGTALELPVKRALLVRVATGCPGAAPVAAELQGFTASALALTGPAVVPAELYGALARPIPGPPGLEERLWLSTAPRDGTLRLVVPAGGAPLCVRELWVTAARGPGG